MDKLPQLIKALREAQGVTQAELAKFIGVSQPSIALYEKGRASLSIETLNRFAPLLNLSPSYIKSRQGNPFKQADPKKIIKLLVLDDFQGNPDFSLVKLIAETNHAASFFFLKPDFIDLEAFSPTSSNNVHRENPKWRKLIRRGLTIYALFVQDETGNSYLFKKKDDSLFSENQLIPDLQEIETKLKRHFDIRTTNMGFSTLEIIKGWSELSSEELSEVFYKAKFFPNRTFLLRLLHEVWGRKQFNADFNKYERLKSEISGMDESQLNDRVKNMIPDLEEVIAKYFMK